MGQLAPWGVVVVAGASLPLLRETFYGFLGVTASAAVPLGAGSVAARLGLALAALAAFQSYSVLVRGEDRGVVDLHPLLPRLWVTARAGVLLRALLPWMVAAVVLLAPLATVSPAAFLATAVATTGSTLAGAAIGAGVNLTAPRIALDPRWAPVLDAIRGHNPRMQAALIWAPGVALSLAGSAALAASSGVTLMLDGRALGAVLLAVPFVSAAIGARWALSGAPGIVRLPALLGEIEAAWSQVDMAEDHHAVYLEWTIRHAPPRLRRDTLRELRHVWRGLRTWATGSWALAFASGLAAWTPGTDGIDRWRTLTLGALVVMGFIGVRLAATDPSWLQETLGLRRTPVATARLLALLLLMQPVLLTGAATLGIRHGVGALAGVIRMELAALVLAALGAVTGEVARARGAWVYVPAALLVWVIGGPR